MLIIMQVSTRQMKYWVSSSSLNATVKRQITKKIYNYDWDNENGHQVQDKFINVLERKQILRLIYYQQTHHMC